MSSRRDFFKTVAAGGTGLAVAFHLQGGNRFARAAAAAGPFKPNAFLRITPENVITVVIKHAEMGQGVATSLPMIVAEELDADWQQIQFEFAPAHKDYNHTVFGAMITGGSTSIATSYDQMRHAGATARAMLVAAAAAKWQVDASECSTADSHVIHKATNRKLSYGKLANDAAGMKAPEKVQLKDPKDFKIIGKPTKRLDGRSKTDGTAQFGADVQLPGMLTAVVARAPIFGAKLKTFNADKAMAMKGVKKIFPISSGVAVVAADYWSALKAREELEVTWDETNAPKLTTDEMYTQYKEMSLKPGMVATGKGDAAKALEGKSDAVGGEFFFPFLAHAPMEPLNCVAKVADGACEIWTGTQFQTMDQGVAAQILQIPPEKVKVNTTMLGGGFGRRANIVADFSSEAVQVAKEMSPTPVKVMWSREDDMRGGYYRPMYVHNVKASVDDKGMPHAWHHRIVGQSIIAGTAFESALAANGIDSTSVEGASDLPYNVPNLQVEYHKTEATVPILWWRSVGHTHTAFVVETVLDELAAVKGKDPYEYRMQLLGADHARHKAVLELVAKKAGWGKPLEKKDGWRRGRGLALHESFASVVAQIADVSVSNSGKVVVDKVYCAIHCGRVINPTTVEAQMQSGIVYGLTALLNGKITLNKGHVEQSNFHDYQPLRISEMPVVEAYMVPSDAAPPASVNRRPRPSHQPCAMGFLPPPANAYAGCPSTTSYCRPDPGHAK